MKFVTTCVEGAQVLCTFIVDRRSILIQPSCIYTIRLQVVDEKTARKTTQLRLAFWQEAATAIRTHI
jgi:hypothetical protein